MALKEKEKHRILRTVVVIVCFGWLVRIERERRKGHFKVHLRRFPNGLLVYVSVQSCEYDAIERIFFFNGSCAKLVLIQIIAVFFMYLDFQFNRRTLR